MEKVYLYKINREELLRKETQIFELLPEWRKEKVSRMKVESARLQSLAAGRILTIALSDYPEAGYNITHSGDYVAVAVSDKSIGIDIERKSDDNFKVTRRVFEDQARDYIAEDQNRFRDVWTVKEAFLKCRGIGIVVPLDVFTTTYGLDSVMKINPLIEEDNQYYDRLFNDDYYVLTKRIEDEGYSMSVCSPNSNLTLDIERVEVLV